MEANGLDLGVWAGDVMETIGGGVCATVRGLEVSARVRVRVVRSRTDRPVGTENAGRSRASVQSEVVCAQARGGDHADGCSQSGRQRAAPSPTSSRQQRHRGYFRQHQRHTFPPSWPPYWPRRAWRMQCMSGTYKLTVFITVIHLGSQDKRRKDFEC